MGLKRRIRVEPEFSLAAMIDVIFLMLMFFMLTSNTVTTSALNLQLPSSSSKTMAERSLTVEVIGGAYKLDGKVISTENLEAGIRATAKALELSGKSNTINIACDEMDPLKSVVFVMDIAQRLKLKTILQTKPTPTQ
jgi:biopolymer transport protein ExbD